MTQDIAELGKKQAVTPEAQALTMLFTKKFHTPDEKSAELPNLEDDVRVEELQSEEGASPMHLGEA